MIAATRDRDTAARPALERRQPPDMQRPASAGTERSQAAAACGTTVPSAAPGGTTVPSASPAPWQSHGGGTGNGRQGREGIRRSDCGLLFGDGGGAGFPEAPAADADRQAAVEHRRADDGEGRHGGLGGGGASMRGSRAGGMQFGGAALASTSHHAVKHAHRAGMIRRGRSQSQAPQVCNLRGLLDR